MITLTYDSRFVPYDQLPQKFSGVKLLRSASVVEFEGNKLNRARFNVIFGGHTFGINATNDKTTNSPWVAFMTYVTAMALP